jgi:hypothetical protein
MSVARKVFARVKLHFQLFFCAQSTHRLSDSDDEVVFDIHFRSPSNGVSPMLKGSAMFFLTLVNRALYCSATWTKLAQSDHDTVPLISSCQRSCFCTAFSKSHWHGKRS